MRHLSVFAVWVLLAGSAYADVLGGAIEVKPHPAWIQTDASNRPVPFPTLAYKPRDDRNAQVMITLLPAKAAKITGAAALKQFHRLACSQYLPNPEVEYPVQEIKLSSGIGYAATFEDPNLVGKPSKKGDFKYSTVVGILLGSDYLIHATIFTDAKTGIDYQEGMGILRSLTIVAKPSAAPGPDPAAMASAPIFSAPNLRTSLAFGERFAPPTGDPARPGYFLTKDNSGYMVSGWLEAAAQYKGLRAVWSHDKAAMIEGGLTIEDESFKLISGWSVVTYVVKVADTAQKNLRACRVYGDTWVDIHISNLQPNVAWSGLEDALKAVTVMSKP